MNPGSNEKPAHAKRAVKPWFNPSNPEESRARIGMAFYEESDDEYLIFVGYNEHGTDLGDVAFIRIGHMMWNLCKSSAPRERAELTFCSAAYMNTEVKRVKRLDRTFRM